ncbi:MAG: ATP-dependent helicase HrpB [Opitutaceae bacterium]|nr:ATP-dependent helicase HrpB [Opitutaceae bacterium]
MDPLSLPIYELEHDLVTALSDEGRVIVQAPTGSGKSTQLPKMLLKHGFADGGQVVVLQPRRLATRMLAKRVAEEMGTALGETVGYQIRLEARISAATRVKFVTEGVLLRQMAGDAALRGINVIVFDEFHERHLYGDITLARAIQIQQSTRPDLRIVVMSATLDTVVLKKYLEPCRVLTSQGRTFPVEVRYQTKSVDFERDAVWEVAARECERVAADTYGDMLVFMPGAYEISRTLQAIGASRALHGFDCLPLHGELPPEQQDRAVERGTTRKIIVSTNVAETSLTIDGVTAVIDSGLARVARFDPHRGINTLLVEKISVANADQRAGRAGRTAPGVCVRLWTEREHEKRALQELPEVKRLDLAEVVLTLKASGIDDVVGFPWIEPPEPKALEKAETLLADLGAISALERCGNVEAGHAFAPQGGAQTRLLTITEIGRKMLRFPLHPRYARMLLEAEKRGCVRAVALMAALTQGRNFLLRGVTKQVEQARAQVLGEEHESDFLLLMRAWQEADRTGYRVEACRELGIHAQAARAVGPVFAQFLKIAEREGLDTADHPVPEAELRKCVLAGFSDQVAKRLDAGTLRCELVHGRRGMLARESVCQHATLLVTAEITEIGGRGGEVNTVLNLATAMEEAWLNELFPDDYQSATGVSYDESAKRVVARRERRFRDLVLESKVSGDEVLADEAAALLTREVLVGRIKLESWDEVVDQWIIRVNRLAEWFPELEVNPIREEDRATLIEQLCYGEVSAKAVRDKPVMPVLREWLTAEQLAVLDVYLPERLTMANGRKSKLRYPAEGPPILSARIQELYGIEGKFTLGQGRVPVKIEVLAPNQRPIQVTDDLTNFWREQYPKIKTELSRRYPRHEWR